MVGGRRVAGLGLFRCYGFKGLRSFRLVFLWLWLRIWGWWCRVFRPLIWEVAVTELGGLAPFEFFEISDGGVELVLEGGGVAAQEVQGVG